MAAIALARLIEIDAHLALPLAERAIESVTAIKADSRFAKTSIWVTTTRKFVTLQGCVRNAAQKKALERLVKGQPDVAIVWNETTVGVKP